MRKKQLFAILLAGAMTAGTVPSAALAAENDIPAASSEVTEGENSGEIPQEEGGETTPEAVPSEAPETLESEPTGISIITIDENNQETVTYYKTLQEAVDAAPTIESGAQESTVRSQTALHCQEPFLFPAKRSALSLPRRESPFAESRRKTEQYLTERCSQLPDRAASFSFL